MNKKVELPFLLMWERDNGHTVYHETYRFETREKAVEFVKKCKEENRVTLHKKGGLGNKNYNFRLLKIESVELL